MYRFSQLSAALMLLMVLAGCGGAGQRLPEAGAGSGPAIPAPAQLHLVSAEGDSPFRYGGEYDGALPNARVFPHGDGLTFWPATNVKTGNLEPAYALYLIDLPDYAHEPVVQLETQSQAFDGWIGFANFAENHWEWQPLGDVTMTHYINAFDPAQHVKDNQILVALVALTSLTVDWLVAGDTTKPEITTAHPKIMVTGTEVQFRAEFRYSGADTYHWKFGGGISPSASDSALPSGVAQAPGTYTATLEVANALGADSFSFSYEVVTQQTIPPMQLQALPDQTSVAVGEPVKLTIRCGRFPQQEQMHSCQVCLQVSEHASYVAHSFNLGAPGGTAYNIDGIWSLFPEPPTDWIPTPDAWFGPVAADAAGMVWLMFGSAAIDAGETKTGGNIYSLQVAFDAPGVYDINFAPNGGFKRTWFSDLAGGDYCWYDIGNDAAPVITVTQ